MNQKQRKAKLKRAQHHQRQSVEVRKEVLQEHSQEHWQTWQMCIDKAKERQTERHVESTSQRRIHVDVPRRHSSISYWFQRLAVKIALAAKSAYRFLIPKTRH